MGSNDPLMDFDVEQELDEINSGNSSTMATILEVVVGGILFLFSAGATFGFFYNYAGGVFSFVSPTLGPYIDGILGVIAYEVMCVVWAYLKVNKADTDKQMDYANYGLWGTLAGAVAITVVYLSIDSRIASGFVDEGARFFLSILGTFLIIFGTSGNFLLWRIYKAEAAEVKAAENRNKLIAKRNAATFSLMSQFQRQVIKDVRTKIKAAIPAVSDNLSGQIEANFTAQQLDVLRNLPQLTISPNDDNQAKNEKVEENAGSPGPN